MNFTKSQNLIINKLKDNANELNCLTPYLLTLEGRGCKGTYEYSLLLNKYQKALSLHDEILASDEFDIDFMAEFRELIISNLDNLDHKETIIAKRILGELEDKLSDFSLLKYDRDIFMVMLCLLDNYIYECKNCDLLKKNLITLKYVLPLKISDITMECATRNYDFKDNVYVFSEAFSQLNGNNEYYSLEDYAMKVFLMFANELLNFKNDDYYNPEENCYAIQTFFLVESAILFLEEEITWDFCEVNLEIDDNNTTSIDLLKKALKSKGETRKRVNFVSFVQ